jgi:hypothetical protein
MRLSLRKCGRQPGWIASYAAPKSLSLLSFRIVILQQRTEIIDVRDRKVGPWSALWISPTTPQVVTIPEGALLLL